eukprot:5516649-Pyramimonas_sp.AAC.1
MPTKPRPGAQALLVPDDERQVPQLRPDLSRSPSCVSCRASATAPDAQPAALRPPGGSRQR